MLITETGSCSRLQLVFVHAENDTTMPWAETEALFKSTLKAAVEVTSSLDGPPKDLKVIDLGEAGRQEVWHSGSKCIQKTIAKHGGKRARAQNPGRAFRHSFLDFFVAQKPLDKANLLCRLRASIHGLPEALPVPRFANVYPARGAHGSRLSRSLLYPCGHHFDAELSGLTRQIQG
jgi:hypothetical protein